MSRLDYVEAERLRAEGHSFAEIARHFGVSFPTARRAADPAYRAIIDACRRDRLYWVTECEDCGGPAARRYPSRRQRPDGAGPLCRACASKRKATTVRETELLCTTCDEWKPDDRFPRANGKKSRRGRHSTCRACQAAVKREWRWRNAAVCESCGGPRGGDTDQGALARGHRPTGLCLACYRRTPAGVKPGMRA